MAPLRLAWLSSCSGSKVGIAEGGSAEGGLAESGSAESGVAEVGKAEVGFVEVGFAEVRLYLWILFPPLIPSICTLLEYLKVVA